jgi:RHS repeat-associated protein
MATHGEVRGISYSPDDRFCLEGNPLVLISGVYGEDGSEYRAERDGFDKIVFHEGAGAFSPSSFEVWAKDGRLVRYESLKAFRAEASPAWPYTIQPVNLVEVVWVLSEVKNRAGDRIVYRYVILPSPDPFAIEYVLDRIEYPLRPGEETGKREVKFVYEDRYDPSFTWVSGVSFRMTKRLKEIEMYAPNPTAKGLVQRYLFSYLKSPSTQRSLLQAITRCDGDNACLWSKELDWETTYHPDFEAPIDLNVAEFPLDYFVKPNGDSGILVFDGDGDGKDEILYRVGADYFLRRMAADGTPLGERVLIDPILSAPGPGLPGFHDIFLNQTRPVDIDGDGSIELFAAQAVYLQYHVFKLDGASGQLRSANQAFGATELLNGGAYSFEALNFGDLDGDGRVDLLHQVFTSTTDSVWEVFKNKGKLPFENPTLTDVPAFGGNAARILDGDGDGRAEVWNASDFGGSTSHTMRLDAGGNPVVNGQPGLGFEAKRALFADLNGDGLRDIVRPATGSGWVRWSTGAGYGPKQDLVNGPEPDGNANPGMDQGTSVADLNSDGREDILAFRFSPSPQVIAYLSRGDGSFDPVVIATWPGQFHAYDGFSTSRAGDFDADGLIDVVVVDDNHHLRVLLQKPGQVDVVRAIGDSVTKDPREVIHYSNQWSDAPESAACSFPQRCIRHGMPVVREHWTWQGSDVGQYRKVLYDYQDPRVDLHGRGFSGFGKVRVRDVDRGSETSITYNHGKRDGTIYPEAGLPKTVTHVAPILEGAPPSLPATVRARITEVQNSYALKLLNGDRTHAVHPSEWISSEWEQDVILNPDGVEVPFDPSASIVRKRSGSFEFDEYGNGTKVEEETQGGVRRVLKTTYDIRPDDWLISLPDMVTYVAMDNSPTYINGVKHVPAPRVVHYVHDSLGFLKTVNVEPAALDPHEKLTTTFERNSDGLVTLITSEAPGEAPRHVGIGYDGAEGIFPVKVWNDLGYTQGFAFHPAYGVLAVSRDENGVETRVQHDAFGRVRRAERDGEAGVDIFSSVNLKNGWVAGLIKHMQSDAGDAGYTAFDELERPVEEAVRAFDGQWSRSAIAYDLLGRIKHVTRPELGGISLNKTQYFYDTLNRLVSVQAPDGSVTAFEHELLKVTTIEPGGAKNILVSDVEGRVEQSIDILDGQDVPTTFVYGSFDLIRNVIDPEGNITSLNYDKRGRRTSLVDPDRAVTITTYNGFDEILTEENALGPVTVFKRDILGRVYERDDADGITKFTWSAQHGRLGLLESTESPDGTKTEHWYDDFGRPTISMWTLSAGDAYAVTRHYDPLGRLKSIDYPAVPERPQFSVEYDYTPHNYLEKIRDPASQGLPFWTVQSRNADGALTQALRGDGALHKRSYKLLTGQLDVLELQKAGVTLDSIKHMYFTSGNLKTRTDSVNSRTETFGYDDLERLTSWKLDTPAGKRETTYQYDLIGNLKQVQENGALIADNEYGTNGKPHALTWTKSNALQSSYLYDAIGRIKQGGGRDIEYTAFDLPRSITQNAVTTDFAYDAFGRRVRKSKPGSSSIYVAELYEKREKNGEIDHVFFIPGELGLIAEVHWKQGKPQEDKTLYLHGDALGSTRVVTGGKGGGVQRMYFEPFGQRIEYDGTPSAQGYTPSTEIGLTGFQHDDDLGLVNARGRIYDPTIRRFITPDPLVAFPLFGQSYNRFSFCLNNPLSFVDPTGFRADRASDRPAAPHIQDGKKNVSGKALPASPRPKQSATGGKPLQGGANGAAPASADAHGNETNTGPRATATTPPASAPPTAADAPPATAAPTAVQPSPATATEPPLGAPPPDGGGEGGGSWKDHEVVQIEGGFVAGFGLSLVPFASFGAQVASNSGHLPRGTRAAELGRAVGEMVGGTITFITGVAGIFGGGALVLAGGPPAGPVSATAIAKATVVAVGGVANMGGGIAGLAQALSTGGGSTQGSVRVTGAKLKELRTEFQRVKSQFWKHEAASNTSKYTPENLARMQKGKPPIGPDGHPMELHHIRPLTEGGTNDFSNLQIMNRTDHRLGPNFKSNHPNLP